jgi:nitrite reductase (NO-forming)
MQRFRVLTLTLGLGVLLGASGCITMPGSAGAKVHDVTFTATESEIVIDGTGTKYKAWTFNGQMPGPVVRVTEGDTVNFTLINPPTNAQGHSMDFHAAELDFLKNYREIKPGETIKYTFVAKKPGVIQHIGRGMFGAIIVDPKDASVWPKADREFVLVQSELWKNPDNVQAMFDRKFDHQIFNGGVFKYHPFFPGSEPLEVKVGERVRIYFVNAGPNEFSSLHPIAEIWDNVYESGNPHNKFTGVQTYVVGPGSAATFDLIADEPGAYPVVTHSLTGALRGAIAVVIANQSPKKYDNLMPLTPWNP